MRGEAGSPELTYAGLYPSHIIKVDVRGGAARVWKGSIDTSKDPGVGKMY